MGKPLNEIYNFAWDAIKRFLQTEPIDFRIEQVEYYPEGSVAAAVVSYRIPRDQTEMEKKIGLPFYAEYERAYKEIKLGRNGNLKGIYIYNPIKK